MTCEARGCLSSPCARAVAQPTSSWGRQKRKEESETCSTRECTRVLIEWKFRNSKPKRHKESAVIQYVSSSRVLTTQLTQKFRVSNFGSLAML